ncbi:hypothetical protein S40285_06367 [Stachybotrys chlorohalonatus IBT 40285]|uniref:Pyridoxamine 5'-phosphate oxidase putative domain-containing protein n=1 Tax=Stachybotrys chlorohalonatus (strain IBT 40285) TaxID=1283841 RepID=A0A084QED7_STAC4|nr:hypothetical protein S40285_06367 [Stachybotrys chlorohalonata IBT 40285]
MKLYPSLSDDLADWVQRQPVFFTGTAPTHAAHINVSPKGLADSHFAVIDANQCAYIDRTGSGCETISHAYENGRLCLMFMSFGESPRILRLFCRATVVEWDQPGFPDWVRKVARGKREAFDGARAVIICDIWQVQTSCGYGVPRIKKAIYAAAEGDADASPVLLPKEGEKADELAVFETRPTLDKWASHQATTNQMLDYQAQSNATSIDGLPGLKTARRSVSQWLWLEEAKAKARNVLAEKEALAAGFSLAVFLYCISIGIQKLV